MTGLYLFAMFSLIAALFYTNTVKGMLTIVVNVLMIMLGTAQTIFLIVGLRLSARKVQQVKHNPVIDTRIRVSSKRSFVFQVKRRCRILNAAKTIAASADDKMIISLECTSIACDLTSVSYLLTTYTISIMCIISYRIGILYVMWKNIGTRQKINISESDDKDGKQNPNLMLTYFMYIPEKDDG
jgi:hypothetical protein